MGPVHDSEGTEAVGLANLRDVGGLQTLDGGVVRAGVVYRSSVPSRLGPEGRAAYGSLRLRSIVDLRTPWERAAAPTIVPDGAEYYAIDVLADATDPSPIEVERMLAEPARTKRLEQGSLVDLAERRFRQLVALDSAKQGFGTLFDLLARATARPMLIHCSTGKDRTGWAIAALLSLLTVAREDIVRDYLLSAKYLAPSLTQWRHAFAGQGGDIRVFDALMGVKRIFLEAAFAEAEQSYGSVAGYFDLGLGVSRATQRSLKETLVER